VRLPLSRQPLFAQRRAPIGPVAAAARHAQGRRQGGARRGGVAALQDGDAEERAGLVEPRTWGRVLGPALAFSLGLQAVTGMLVASFCAPSSTTGWGAVAYIQQEVTLGWFIRGLHSAGASLTVVLLGLHLVQAIASGSYATAPRRNWLLGLGAGGL